jgi:SAM-dependent methyltransferase
MLRQSRTFQGFGADISDEMAKAASRDIPDMEFVATPCDKLPFQDGFFDVVTVCAAFHYFPDIVAFATEARRIIKPGGRLYIAEIYYSKVLRTLANPFIRFHPSGDVKFYAPEEITVLLNCNGFNCEPVLIDGNIMIITGSKRCSYEV